MKVYEFKVIFILSIVLLSAGCAYQGASGGGLDLTKRGYSQSALDEHYKFQFENSDDEIQSVFSPETLTSIFAAANYLSELDQKFGGYGPLSNYLIGFGESADEYIVSFYQRIKSNDDEFVDEFIELGFENDPLTYYSPASVTPIKIYLDKRSLEVTRSRKIVS